MKKDRSKECALLQCESCGNTQRVWLNKCTNCTSPEAKLLLNRIDELENKIKTLDKINRKYVDMLNDYSMKVRRLEKEIVDKK